MIKDFQSQVLAFDNLNGEVGVEKPFRGDGIIDDFCLNLFGTHTQNCIWIGFAQAQDSNVLLQKLIGPN